VLRLRKSGDTSPFSLYAFIALPQSNSAVCYMNPVGGIEVGICTIETKLIKSSGFPQLKLATHELTHFPHHFCLYIIAEVGKKVAYGEGLVSPKASGDKIPADLY